MDEKYIKKLEDVIGQMLEPLRNIPISLVIKKISGYKIIPFNIEDDKDKKLLEQLKLVAQLAGEEINKEGIRQKRPNEVGNAIEPFVKESLIKIGFEADTPTTQEGKKKASGYPDIEFVDDYNRTNYLECKTYNASNYQTTQRSFYFSPSEEFKITKDAHHFMLSYEIEVVGRDGDKNIYKTKSWKLITLENLDVDVKYEFNSDNKRMYTEDLIIAEGIIEVV